VKSTVEPARSAPPGPGPRGVDLALFGAAPVLPAGSHTLWPIVGDEERRAVARVLDRGILSGPFAPEAVAFQAEFAAFVGAKHAILTHCGTSALSVALAAAGVRAGDEVIVPAYSFVATPLCVTHVGAVPVFADVDVATGCLDPAAADAAITARTRAIMPVHMHGGAADMTAIMSLAARRGLIVVEDAAQAHGARCDGRPVGAIGAAGGFSLQSSKNLSAGEGGVLVTNDAQLADEANSVRNFGQDLRLEEGADFDDRRPLDGTRSLDSRRIGSMYRGNEMMAAFARAQLSRLSERTERCIQNGDRLSRALAGLAGVSPPSLPPGRTSVHHKYRVHLDPAAAGVNLSPERFRDAVAAALRAEGLEVVMWQSVTLPAQTVFQKRDPRGGFPQPLEGGADLAHNYDPARYPRTKALLAGSIVLFSQSCPLIAQADDVVDRYAEAFRRVWRNRTALCDWAARQSS
jgi:dTDP-4-amino-4,6-dideoxygalactose transaminase